ncbi:MAG TPA: FAD-binding oxidoreductase [Ktedonobacterales bacterium]|nr:FAD-binding oxidoreductase [Ktedonobacterales bacterium]
MTPRLDGAIDGFRADFHGTVITPGDPGYDDARSLWNGAINRRPALIAQCASAEDVATAIQFARRQELEIAVRGGGHNFAGLSICDGGMMISLTGMRQVTVDPSARRAVCGGGATWADLDAASQAHGLAVTGGFVSHTGVGGLTLGGGIGWLTRKLGLSCDNLLAAEVVTANGQILRASANENVDLFWALRGGGGNFGVVTSFEFQLHTVGPLVNLGLFFWGVDQGAEALRFSRDVIATLPAEVGILIAGLSAPPAPFVPEQYHLAPGYALALASFGSPEEHERLAQPIRAALPPLFELVTPIPYTQLQQMFDEGNPWGILAYEKSLSLDDLSDDAIAVICEHFPRKLSPLSFMPIFVLDGAYGQVGEDATAFSGSRASRFLANIAAVCPTPEMLEADRAWVRALWDALQPFASGARNYVNFMASDEEDRVRLAYGADKYERLARVKAEYDPDNIFHRNMNIAPALAPAQVMSQRRDTQPG